MLRAKGSKAENFGLQTEASSEASDQYPPSRAAPFDKETLATHRPASPNPAFEIRLFDILRFSIFCGFFLLSGKKA